MNIIPVILCGGAGSRLWPLSREHYPKPFIRLQDRQSLLQKAIIRAASLSNVNELVIVCNSDLFHITENELNEVNENNLACTFILEPIGRNTAPAITSAAIAISKKYDDGILLVLAADHLITKQVKFNQAVIQACKLAKKNNLVTFGILPSSAETGYGYLEVDGDKVLKFIEKPKQEDANKFISKGNYYWNSGIFCFKTSTLLSQIKEHGIDLYSQVCESINKANISKLDSKNQKIELSLSIFSKVRDVSIDYAVMEKSKYVAVVPCDIGWSDIGSWNVISEFIDADENNNRVLGKAQIDQSKNCTIYGSGRLVGLAGVNDLVVVDTPDALLITNKQKTQNVKQIYQKLKASGDSTYYQHQTVYRPWGSYTVLEENEGYKIKRIEVKPKQLLSLQMHNHRSEHWVVVQGIAKVVNQDQELLLNTNDSIFIPVGNKHRMENPGLTTLIIIEVQYGKYLEEDDIVRFEDQYGRN